MQKHLIKFLVPFLILQFSGCGIENNPRMINIDSHSLSMFSKGNGVPTIVIDVGIGDSYKEWMKIIDTLSLYTRVVAYDRAGYGKSEAGPFPRDCQQEVIELNTMLERVNVEKPYLLVGHSLGALNAQYYAYIFPASVTGMVLLDPPPLNWINGKVNFPNLDSLISQQIQLYSSLAEQIRTSINPEDESKAIYFETLTSEHEAMFSSSAEQIASIGSFSDLPITIIASGKPNPRFGDSAERFQKFWINENKSLSMKSTRGKLVLLEQSSHFIYHDYPGNVISEIIELLVTLRNIK